MNCLKHDVPLIMGPDVAESWIIGETATRVLMGECPVCHRVFSMEQTTEIDWDDSQFDNIMEV